MKSMYDIFSNIEHRIHYGMTSGLMDNIIDHPLMDNYDILHLAHTCPILFRRTLRNLIKERQ